jgi:putative ATPase
MDFFDRNGRNTDDRTTGDLAPLADRMRPRKFGEFVGQEKIVGPGTALRKAIEEDKVPSVIFWGPPGSGKTTLARLIARATEGQFIPFSAVTSSIKEVKQVLSKSGNYYKMSGRRTYVFVDEIHRFNKAQQDAFLPYVETGEIVLIGATTENPSFEVISALLSRMRVYVLERLSEDALSVIIEHALSDTERGLGEMNLNLDDSARASLSALADGDARRVLALVEGCAQFVGEGGTIDASTVKKVSEKTALLYDRAGEEHYNIVSALHKSIRGGDPDASLYWLARMLEGGDEPRFIIRRLIRAATEDVGLADPFALTFATSVREAYDFIGSPEGDLAIAQLVVYLACAPKSNAIYTAFGKARQDAATKGSLGVPLWIRNAPTNLMKDLGYGEGYKYAHDYEDALTDQEYFPEELAGTQYYSPTEAGREARIGEYLAKFREYRKKVRESADTKKN